MTSCSQWNRATCEIETNLETALTRDKLDELLTDGYIARHQSDSWSQSHQPSEAVKYSEGSFTCYRSTTVSLHRPHQKCSCYCDWVF